MQLTEEQYHNHCAQDDGYCAGCDDITRFGSTEPDAEGYVCDGCGGAKVSGVEQAVVAGLIEIISDDEDDEGNEDRLHEEEEPEDE